METITLYYQRGSSDKIYQAKITPTGDGFTVDFAYGRRGTMLQTGTKTVSPVDHATAVSIFDKLVKSKLAKGYTHGEDGAACADPVTEQRDSGLIPQLPCAVEEGTGLEELLCDDAFCMQEKFDGTRLLVRKIGDKIVGINRRGLITAIPKNIQDAIADHIQGDCLIDGECLGDQYVVFDVLVLGAVDCRQLSYRKRLDMLREVDCGGTVRIVETALGQMGKRNMLEQLRCINAEGVVFKRLDAPYVEGRNPSQGPFKHKFYASASFIVAERNGNKRSVGLALLKDGVQTSAGNVTVPANHRVPAKGAVIEVRYLYAYPQSGAVYQPVYLGERADIVPQECSVGQLKFKPAVPA